VKTTKTTKTDKVSTAPGDVERLAAIGVADTEVNIRNKVSRGGFSAVFLLQCLEAIGCTNITLTS
jgi:hypothetical protein